MQDYRNYNSNLVLFPSPIFFLLFMVCDFIAHLEFITSNSVFISIVFKINIFTVFPRNVFHMFVFEGLVCESLLACFLYKRCP